MSKDPFAGLLDLYKTRSSTPRPARLARLPSAASGAISTQTHVAATPNNTIDVVETHSTAPVPVNSEVSSATSNVTKSQPDPVTTAGTDAFQNQVNSTECSLNLLDFSNQVLHTSPDDTASAETPQILSFSTPREHQPIDPATQSALLKLVDATNATSKQKTAQETTATGEGNSKPFQITSAADNDKDAGSMSDTTPEAKNTCNSRSTTTNDTASPQAHTGPRTATQSQMSNVMEDRGGSPGGSVTSSPVAGGISPTRATFAPTSTTVNIRQPPRQAISQTGQPRLMVPPTASGSASTRLADFATLIAQPTKSSGGNPQAIQRSRWADPVPEKASPTSASLSPSNDMTNQIRPKISSSEPGVPRREWTQARKEALEETIRRRQVEKTTTSSQANPGSATPASTVAKTASSTEEFAKYMLHGVETSSKKPPAFSDSTQAVQHGSTKPPVIAATNISGPDTRTSSGLQTPVQVLLPSAIVQSTTAGARDTSTTSVPQPSVPQAAARNVITSGPSTTTLLTSLPAARPTPSHATVPINTAMTANSSRNSNATSINIPNLVDTATHNATQESLSSTNNVIPQFPRAVAVAAATAPSQPIVQLPTAIRPQPIAVSSAATVQQTSPMQAEPATTISSTIVEQPSDQPVRRRRKVVTVRIVGDAAPLIAAPPTRASVTGSSAQNLAGVTPAASVANSDLARVVRPQPTRPAASSASTLNVQRLPSSDSTNAKSSASLQGGLSQLVQQSTPMRTAHVRTASVASSLIPLANGVQKLSLASPVLTPATGPLSTMPPLPSFAQAMQEGAARTSVAPSSTPSAPRGNTFITRPNSGPSQPPPHSASTASAQRPANPVVPGELATSFDPSAFGVIRKIAENLKPAGSSSSTITKVPVNPAVKHAKSNEDLENKERFAAWPKPADRGIAPVQPRIIELRNIPLNADALGITNLLFGGTIESIDWKERDSFATVRFLTHEGYRNFFGNTPNGVFYPGTSKHGKAVWVENVTHLQPLSSVVRQAVDNYGATRCVKATGVEADWGGVALKNIGRGGRDGKRMVAGITDELNASKVRVVTWHFMSIAAAIEFWGHMQRNEDAEGWNLVYVPDPCATATGPRT